MLVLALLLRRRVWNWTSWIFCFFVGRSNRRVWDAFFVLKSLGKQGFEVCRRKKCIDNARVRWLGPVQFFLETYYPKNYHRFWFIPGGLGEPNSKTMPRATSNARRNLFFQCMMALRSRSRTVGNFCKRSSRTFCCPRSGRVTHRGTWWCAEQTTVPKLSLHQAAHDLKGCVHRCVM